MKTLITAGPTREPIDAVRFISNRSSGKMGLALASAALEAGHEVTLLLGPGPEERQAPGACRLYRFEAALDLQRLLEQLWPEHQLLIMAAAVADYRPVKVFDGKLARQSGQSITLELAPTPDLVAQMAAAKRPDQRVVAFALEEPKTLPERALGKLRRKRVDAVVANSLAALEAEAATALWITAERVTHTPGEMSKRDLARWIVALIGQDPHFQAGA